MFRKKKPKGETDENWKGIEKKMVAMEDRQRRLSRPPAGVCEEETPDNGEKALFQAITQENHSEVREALNAQMELCTRRIHTEPPTE